MTRYYMNDVDSSTNEMWYLKSSTNGVVWAIGRKVCFESLKKLVLSANMERLSA